jgi:protein involved in polysaccharide export with SLBB domain
MRAVNLFRKISFVFALVLVFSFMAAAQEIVSQEVEKIAQSKVDKKKKKNTDKLTETEKKSARENADASNNQAAQTAQIAGETKEEEEIISYYTNYLQEYRLGAQDVISVEVFGQCPDYCITGITVPPTARISYPLIREGVFVGGKTIEQIQQEITKQLDEYIIDPKVTVTLDKAGSARYSVLGKVNSPGIRIMDRKVSLYEAVVESGGVTKEGNKKKIVLLRFGAQGKLIRQEVNLEEVERGKAGMIYLSPGDQVFVPSKGFQFNIETIFKTMERVSLVRLLLGSPF